MKPRSYGENLQMEEEKAYMLGLAKRDLWGLGAVSWFVVASYAFAKMILQCTEVRFVSFLSGGFITAIHSSKSTGKETGKKHLCAVF